MVELVNRIALELECGGMGILESSKKSLLGQYLHGYGPFVSSQLSHEN